MEKTAWTNCYDTSWKGLIVDEAFQHPAKFSRGLIHRIYQHAEEMGWFKAGDWVEVTGNIKKQIITDLEKGDYIRVE